jgi:hypothetical protein
MVLVELLITLLEGGFGLRLVLKRLVLGVLELIDLLLAVVPVVINAGSLAHPNHVIFLLLCHSSNLLFLPPDF